MVTLLFEHSGGGMGDEISTTTDASLSELQELAGKIYDWWDTQSPKISHRKMESRFPDISSTRTLERLKEGEFTKNSVSLLSGYRQTWEMIQNQTTGNVEDPIYENLLPASSVALAVKNMLEAKHSRERVLIVEGDTGRGKTRSLELLNGQMPSAVMVTGDSSWSSSITGVMLDIAKAFGVELDRPSRKRLFDELVKAINDKGRLGNGVVLLVDEGHRLPNDGSGLNLLIDLINKCDRLYLVLAAQNTCWSDLRRKAAQESKQLFYNRAREKVCLTAPDKNESLKFLRQRLGDKSLAFSDADTKCLVDAASANGGYAFLRRVARLLEKTDIIGAVTAAKKEAN
jgi:hypothetical protein